jgi:tetratricopeptide (TPR) repeat protein
VRLATFIVKAKPAIVSYIQSSSPKGDERHRVRGEKALLKFEEWLAHSEWNFKNKQLLLEAEFHFSMKNSSVAATCYEASIEAARKHKFIHEEAFANELAGLFFLEEGQRQKALSYFKQSAECYRVWGAFAIARRVESYASSIASLSERDTVSPLPTKLY